MTWIDWPAKSIRAVLLDRDGTVADPSPGKVAARDAAIARLLGRESFSLTEELEECAFWDCLRWMRLFPVRGVESENLFWLKWFASLLKRAGYGGNAPAAAKRLRDDFVFWKLLEPYPDVPPVLQAIRRAGVRIGIISDSWPSLELSFREMGLAEYIDTYTSAYIVGCCKSDARIHLTALESLDVASGECIFVDDIGKYVEAATHLGMRALRIDRGSQVDDPASGVISTLWPLLDILSIAPSEEAAGPEQAKPAEPSGLAQTPTPGEAR